MNFNFRLIISIVALLFYVSSFAQEDDQHAISFTTLENIHESNIETFSNEEVNNNEKSEDHLDVDDQNLHAIDSPAVFIREQSECTSKADKSLDESSSEEMCEDENLLKIQSITISSTESLNKKSFLSGVNIVDVCLPSSKCELIDALMCYIDEPINEENIECIKQSIKKFYEESFHPFVIIDIPHQKISDGEIKCVVIESKIDDITIDGNKWFSKKNIQNFISSKSGQYIDIREVVQDIYWCNRNPFRRTSIIFSPGSKEGTTNLEYLIKDRYPIRVYFTADNTGFDATGLNRLMTGFNWGNAWGLDHIITFQFTTSPQINRFHSYTASYSLPFWGKNLLTFYGGYAKIHPKDTFEGVKNEGRSVQFSGRYTFPIKPYKHYLQDLSLGFDYKRQNINFTLINTPVIGNQVNITQAVVDYNGKYEIDNYRIPVELLFVLSPGKIMNHQSDDNFSELRPFAKNAYFYAMQKITPQFILKHGFEVALNWHSQFSSNYLISSEQIGLGGYDSVRGYEYRILNKDMGIIFNIEAYMPSIRFIRKAKQSYDSLKFLAFVDFGSGWDHKKFGTVKDFVYLLGIGPGLRYQIAPYLSLRLDLGFKLHRTQFVNNDLCRWHFGFNFNL